MKIKVAKFLKKLGPILGTVASVIQVLFPKKQPKVKGDP